MRAASPASLKCVTRLAADSARTVDILKKRLVECLGVLAYVESVKPQGFPVFLPVQQKTAVSLPVATAGVLDAAAAAAAAAAVMVAAAEAGVVVCVNARS